MSIGHKGMIQASNALGMTMVDLFENPQLIKEVKAEFKERKGNSKYVPMIPPGPPPVPQKK
jgi:aminobenzoyl-glutamate utilization protein B